jgi:hypothetical protein
MPKRIEELTQADIKDLIAASYGVDAADVTIKISAPYNGGQFDSSPGDVTAVVCLGVHAPPAKSRHDRR